MKILFFVESGLGNSALLVDQLSALYKKHKSVYAILSDKDQEEGLTSKIKELSIPYSILPGIYRHHSFKQEAHILKHIIMKEGINIIHVQTNWELILVSYIKYFLKVNHPIKIVYTIHAFRNNHIFKSYIAQILIGLSLFLFADKIICMCNYLKKKFKLLSYKTILLPLGISDSLFFSSRESLEIDKLKLIYPAQFRKGKRQDLVIKAFAKYKKITGDTKSILILPGNGELLDSMKQLSKELSCEQQIIFPGFCSKEEILRLYKTCNTAIISSISETFGQCIVEPYVLGLNIITTKVGIAPDIIINQMNGRYFKNEEELISILIYFHNNPDKIKQFGDYNYEKRNSFRWDIITEKYLESLVSR